jgi:hypothetical protein
MFANDSLDTLDFGRVSLAPMIQEGATACHAAAHAVLSYALGFGVESVSVGVTIGESEGQKTYTLRGEYRGNTARFNRLVPEGKDVAYSPIILSADVIRAGGPAAERKYYIEQGAPNSTLGASERDHDSIDGVGRALQFYGSRNPFAYRRLVWRQAQAALENETIRCAVTCLARELFDLFPETDDLVEHNGTMRGKEAVAIVRAVGVKPGILGFVAKNWTPTAPPSRRQRLASPI